jgi:hypothetical protein
MPSLEELIKQRDDLIAARNTGAKSVRYDDYEIVYRSDTEMRNIIAALDQQISSRRTITTVRISSSKGL